MIVPRTIAVALAAAALALSAGVQAKAADEHPGGGQVPAQTQPRQDLRSPDARDATIPRPRGELPPAGQPRQDLRSPDARDATIPRPRGELPPAGQPSWPAQPSSLHAPAAVTDDSSAPVIPIAAGALGVLLAALAAGYGVRRMHRHPRVAA